MIDRQSLFVSGVLHLVVVVVLFLGLPLFKKNTPPSRIISVSMVPISELTQSPQKAQKKVPRLSPYKKPTYKVGKPIVAEKKKITPPKPSAVPETPQPKPEENKKSLPDKIVPSNKPVPLKHPETAPSLKAPTPAIEKPQKIKEKVFESTQQQAIKKIEEKQSKPSHDTFESVLQSLQDFEKKTDTTKDEMDPRAFDADLISTKISLSELDALRQQLQHCWLVPPTVMGERDLIVEVMIDLDVRGNVTQMKVLNEKAGQKFSFFREAVQSVRQALRAPECTPLRVPLDKYHQWKKCVLRFSPRGID